MLENFKICHVGMLLGIKIILEATGQLYVEHLSGTKKLVFWLSSL